AVNVGIVARTAGEDIGSAATGNDIGKAGAGNGLIAAGAVDGDGVDTIVECVAARKCRKGQIGKAVGRARGDVDDQMGGAIARLVDGDGVAGQLCAAEGRGRTSLDQDLLDALIGSGTLKVGHTIDR